MPDLQGAIDRIKGEIHVIRCDLDTKASKHEIQHLKHRLDEIDKTLRVINDSMDVLLQRIINAESDIINHDHGDK